MYFMFILPKVKILLLTVCILCLTFVNGIHAQALEDLKAPSMPAASIIGHQVNEISKPKTLKALEAQLLNNFTDSSNSLILPKSYALEFSPFMLSNRENFDYLDYLSNSFKNTVWQNLSLSIASASNDRINDSVTGNTLGIGGRILLLAGKVNEEITDSYLSALKDYKQLKKFESQIRTLIGVYLQKSSAESLDQVELKEFLLKELKSDSSDVKEVIDVVFSKIPGNTTKDNVRENFISTYKRTLSQLSLNRLSKILKTVKTERYGWRVELNTAVGLSFPTNSIDLSYVNRYAVWLSSSYRPFKRNAKGLKTPRPYQFIGLARWSSGNEKFTDQFYSTDSSSFNYNPAFDLGLRFVKEFNQFSAEIEYIYRLNRSKETILFNGKEFSRNQDEGDYKLLVNLNYNISSTIVLSYNIGKNFSTPNLTRNDLISGFTLNFGFGNVDREDLLKQIKKEL